MTTSRGQRRVFGGLAVACCLVLLLFAPASEATRFLPPTLRPAVTQVAPVAGVFRASGGGDHSPAVLLGGDDEAFFHGLFYEYDEWPTRGDETFCIYDGPVGFVPRRAAGPSTLHARGRRIGEPIMVSPNEMQSIAKSVRRHVQKLNKRGINSSGERYLDLLAEGDYRAAGAIAHGRMFKRLNSREFLTLNGEKVLINRGRIHPPPGTTSPYGYSYRIPDIQYGSPGTAGFKMWDFKGIHGGWPYTDPTGQFADLAAWTGSRPSALFYHWR